MSSGLSSGGLTEIRRVKSLISGSAGTVDPKCFLGPTGIQGPTGPAGIQGPTGAPAEAQSLPIAYYYLAANKFISGPSTSTIVYDMYSSSESQGELDCVYDTATGILQNVSGKTLTILVAGQITTENVAMDLRYDQPSISIVKSFGAVLNSSVINFKGSSFSTTVLLNDCERLYIQYSYNFPSSTNITGGLYNTHITFTQLEAVKGPTGPVGPAAAPKSLPTAYYFLSSDRTITGPSASAVVYDCLSQTESQGKLDCVYNPITGVLKNTSANAITILVSGQITTTNATMDFNYDQPSISIIKTSGTVLSSSVINFKGSSFSTSVLMNIGEQLYIQYAYNFPGSATIKSGAYNTHIIFTQMEAVQGPTGPVGPPSVPKSLPTAYYFLSANTAITGPATSTIIYDSYASRESQGQLDCSYNRSTGVLQNTSSYTITILVSGQVVTSNSTLDFNYDQPSISIVKTTGTILSSSVINFKGSSFTTAVLLNSGEQLCIQYAYNFPKTAFINGGVYNTHVTFTQLEAVQGPTGPVGPPATVKSLSTAYYYLSGNRPVNGPSTSTIVYDTIASSQSQGILDCVYNPATGVLTNTSNKILTVLVSGQITTDNVTMDLRYDQPSIAIMKGAGAVLNTSAINFRGNSFSTSVLLNIGEQLYIQYTYNFSGHANITGGLYNTHIIFTQLDAVQGPTGPAGPTGPKGVLASLPTAYYYQAASRPVTGPSTTTVIYDTFALTESQATLQCSYDTTTGILRNNSGVAHTILISGQITTDNTILDMRYDQPCIYIVKGAGSVLSSSVINFKGTSFSTSVLLNNGDQLYIQYAYNFPGTVNISGGKYNTHIVFTQLDGAQGPAGTTGATGPAGQVVYATVVFDGGSAASRYPYGPAFDCGQSI